MLSRSHDELWRPLWLLTLASACGFLVVGILASLVSYYEAKQQLDYWIDRSVGSSVVARRNLIDNYLDLQIDMAEQFVGLQPIHQALQLYNAGDLDREEFAAVYNPVLVDAMNHWPSMRGFMCLADDGSVVAQVGEVPDRPLDHSGDKHQPMVMTGGLPVLRTIVSIIENGEPIGTGAVFCSLHPLSHAYQADLGLGLGPRRRLAAMIDDQAVWIIPAGATMDPVMASGIRALLSSQAPAKLALIKEDGHLSTYFFPLRDLRMGIMTELDRTKEISKRRTAMIETAILLGIAVMIGTSVVFALVRPIVVKLAKSQERLVLAQNTARIGTFEFDCTKGRAVWTSELESLYGLEPRTFDGTEEGWMRLIHPDDRSHVRDEWQKALARIGDFRIEFRAQWPDGSTHWLLSRGRVESGDGLPCRALGVNIDIDERKRIEEELKRVNQELEQFAFVASHDLQEPLRMIDSYLTLLRRRYAHLFDDKAQEFFGFAVDGSRRMHKMVRALLEFARTQRAELHRERFDSGEAAREAAHLLDPRIKSTKASVAIADLPAVNGDKDQLIRLFQNLLGNALKYSKPGVPPEVRVDASHADHEWCFNVSDNGVGIPSGQRETIFEPFRRGANAPVKGTGLGLAICRRIVERHGGRIWVESEPNKGASFHFTIPD